MDQTNQSKSKDYYLYQFAITTHIAAKLLLNANVEDYVIYVDEESTGIFGDIIVNVKWKQKTSWCFSFIHLKYETREERQKDDSNKWQQIQLDLKNYYDSRKNFILNKDPKWKSDTSEIDALFFLFSNKRTEVSELSSLTESQSRSFNYCNSIKEFLPLDDPWYKPTSDSLIDKEEVFEHKFYTLLNQFNLKTTYHDIETICQIADPTDLTDCIIDYFMNNERRERGLWKCDFQMQLEQSQILNTLENSILPLTPVAELINDERPSLWNEITLQHDVTIVSNNIDIERCIYGCWARRINQLLNVPFDWNAYLEWNNRFSDGINKKVEEYLKQKKKINTDSVYYLAKYVKFPNTLKSLIKELWKCRDLPLLLKTDKELSYFEKYQHLETSYILINVLSKKFDESVLSSLKIWCHMDYKNTDSKNIHEHINLRDSMLEKTLISLQGRRPICLKDLTNDNSELRKLFTCTDILDLMKKRTVYLREDSINGSDYLAFIVADDEQTTVDCLEGYTSGANIIAYCPLDQSEEYANLLKSKPRYRNYTIYHLRRRNNLLELVEGDIKKLRNYFIDRDGNPVYNLEHGHPIPIVGQMIMTEKRDYVSRDLSRAIVFESYFSLKEKQICLLSGELQTLDENKEVMELNATPLKEHLPEQKTYFLKAETDNIQTYWNELSEWKCPMLNINVRNGKFELMKSSFCNNNFKQSSHISYNGKQLSDEELIKEVKNKTNGITVVLGEPGVGKSTLLRRISNTCDTHKYVIFFDLPDMITHLKKYKLSNANMDNSDFIDFVFEKLQSDLSDKCNSLVSALYRHKRVILILDSFDEIAESWSEQILQSITFTKHCDLHIIIATRLNYSNLLMKQQNVQIVKLERFRQDESKYLTQWKLPKRLLDSVSSEFTANPLYLNFFRTLTDSKKRMTQNKFCLYQQFINMKIKQNMDQTCRYFISYDVNKAVSVFQKLALVAVLGKEYVKQKLGWYYDNNIRNLLKFGIVLDFNEEGKPEFYSDVFINFLCTQWMLKMKNSAKDVYKKMLDDGKLDVLHILHQNHKEKLHRAITKGDVSKVKQICKQSSTSLNVTDGLGRIPLQIAAICCRLSKGSDDSLKILDIIIRIMREERYDMNKVDDIMNWNWTNYIYDDIYSDIDTNVKSNLSTLHTAGYYGNLSVVEKLIQSEGNVNIDVDVVDGYGCTPLDYAIMRHTMLSSQEEAKCDVMFSNCTHIVRLLQIYGRMTTRKHVDDSKEFDDSTDSYTPAEIKLLQDVRLSKSKMDLKIHLKSMEHYQCTVATYLAIKLSTNSDVEDYTICINERSAAIFGDITVRVKLKGINKCYLSLIGVTNEYVTELDFANYRETLQKIKTNATLKCRRDISDNDIFFCLFSIQSLEDIIFSHGTLQVDVSYYSEFDSIRKLLLPFDDNWYKLYSKSEYEDENLVDKFCILLHPCNFSNLDEAIKMVYKLGNPTNITNCVENYFHENNQQEEGLSKQYFEFFIFNATLRYLEVPIAPMTDIICDDEWCEIWNKITLNNDITAIDSNGDVNIQRCIYGCWARILNNLLTTDIDWDMYVNEQNNFSDEIVQNIKKYFDRKKSIRPNPELLKCPTTLKSLIRELWICGALPLLLNTNVNFINFEEYNKYECFERSYIVIDDLSLRRKVHTSTLNICIRVEDIKDRKLRDSMLRKTLISLQGRKPTNLKVLTDDNVELRKSFTCTDILDLIKKRSPYIKEDFLNGADYLAFIIEDSAHEGNIRVVEGRLSGGNIKIYCQPSQLKECIETLRTKTKYSKYDIYHLCRFNNLLQLIEGDKSKLRNCFIDQTGNSIYNIEGEHPIPIAGHMVALEKRNHIQRCLKRPTISKSYFSLEERHICLLSGQLETLGLNVRIIECDVSAVEKHVTQQKTYFFKIKTNDPKKCWRFLCNKKYPLLEINVRSGKCELLRSSRCNNLSPYILYDGEIVSEERFIEEIQTTMDGITVITGEPGIGKSNLLRWISNECDTPNHILLLDLIDLVNQLNKDERIDADEIKCKDFIRVIFENLEEEMSAKHSSFISTLLEHKRIILILDSFDEIEEFWGEQALKSTEFIKHSDFQIIISTRTNSCNLIMNQDNVRIFNLEYLNQNGEEYLSEWKLTTNELIGVPFEFRTHPLFLNFLRELIVNGVSTELGKIFSLCEKFIEMIIKYNSKRTCSYVNAHDIRKTVSLFEILALVAVLGKTCVEQLSNWSYDKNVYDIINIVVNSDKMGNLKFYNNTLRNFLCTQWILNTKQNNLARDIYKAILIQNQMEVLHILYEDLELHRAIVASNVSKVVEICDQHSSYLQDCDKLGRNALHVAAICCRYKNGLDNSLEILEIIIRYMEKSSYDTNQVDSIMNWNWAQYIYDSMHPHSDINVKPELNMLHVASYYGNLDVVQCLIKTKANTRIDVNIIDHDSCTPLDYVVKRHASMFSQDAAENDISPREEDVINMNLIQLLLENGAKINRKHIYNQYHTFLCLAIKAGNLTVLERLLEDEYDVKLNEYDKNKETPISIAARMQNPTTINLLLRRGASVNLPNGDGRTAFNIAEEIGNPSIIKLLLGNNVNDTMGDTAQDIAGRYGSGSDNLINPLKGSNMAASEDGRAGDNFHMTYSDPNLIINPGSIRDKDDMLSDAGMKYRYSVIAFYAASLSKHQNVSDYRIYSCKESYGIFGDIVTKIRLNYSEDVYTSMTQVRYKATQNIDINNVFKEKGLHDIDNLREELEDSKVRFGIFSNKKICTLKQFSYGGTRYKLFSSPLDKIDDITGILLPSTRPKSKFVCNPEMDTPYDYLFKNCYLCLNQPGIQLIKQDLKKICDIDDPDAITTYVSNYFSLISLRKQGMTKHIFETELQKIRFSRSIIHTKVFGKFNEHDWISTWNDITSTQDVTIINNSDRDIDVERNLLGYLMQKLNSLLGVNINEETFEHPDLRKEVHEKFKTYSETHTYRYNVSLPDKLESLLIELWKMGVLPIILQCKDETNFEKYIQPGNKYIIIVNLCRRTLSIPEDRGLKIFRHMGDIADVDRRNKLLENVRVSLQGRQPTTLKYLTDGNEELIKTFNTADIIKLMKPRSLYLKESCLEGRNNLAFFIKDQNYIDDPIMKIPHEMGENIEISCHPDKINEQIRIFKSKCEYVDHTICHLERIDDRLKFLQGDYLRLRSYFIDKYGQPLYSIEEGELIPIIGDVNYFNERNYIPRCLRKSTINMSYFNSEEKQICLVSGDVGTIEFNKIDIENDKLELEEKKTYFVKVIEEERQYYWDKLSSLKYPIFDVTIRGSQAELLRYKCCGNLRQYIEYNGDTISEEQFFEDIKKTNGITVLTGELGMGKSSLVKSLCSNIEKYILFYDLTEYIQHKDRLVSFEDLKSRIFQKRTSKDHNGFLIELFNQNKLIVVLDSYDVIAFTPDLEIAALKLIENIAVRRIPIVICSRTALTVSTDVCSIQTVQLEPLDNSIQTGYVENWGFRAENLVNIPPEFTRNPLYLNFLKIFSKDQKILKGFNRLELYEEVITWIIERSLAATNPYLESEDVEDMKGMFEALAFVQFFGNDTMNKAFIWVLNMVRPKHIRTGIITGVDENIPMFVHFTFVEYFVCKWIIRALQQPRLWKSAVNYYKRLLTDKNARVLEIEFDQASLQKAIIEARISSVETMLKNNRGCLESVDRFGRTVLHIAAIYCMYQTDWSDPAIKILDKILQSMQNHIPAYISKHDKCGMTWAEYVNCEVFENIVLNNFFATLEVYLQIERQNVEQNNKSAVFPLSEESFKEIFKADNWRCFSINVIRDLLFLQNYHDNKIRKFLQECKTNTPSSQLSWTKGRIYGLLAPLHVACVYNSFPMVQRFIKMGDDVNETDQYSCTPLYYNVMQSSLQEDVSRPDNLSIGRLLLNNGANITQPDNGCGTILYTGVKSRNIDIVRMILEHASSKNFQQMTKAEYINMQNRDSSFSLHLAIENGDVDIVKLLLNEGANPNLVDRYGEMSLHAAVNVGNLDIIQTLLASGANINTRNIANLTPLQFAAEKGNTEVVRMLLEQRQIDIQNDCIDAACFSAVLGGNENTINLLLDRITNINVMDKNDDTLLHTAVVHEELNIAALLIKRGATENIINKRGNTPLHYAVKNENVDIVQLLMQKGADPNIRNIKGNTPLHHAAKNSNVQIAQLLLNHKAKVNVKNNDQSTPFFISVGQRSIEMVRLLIEQTKDWNIKQEDPGNLLYEAVIIGNPNIIGILLDNGLDINVKINKGNTPLHIAVSLGNLDVIKLLVEKGSDVNCRNKNRENPVDIALASKNSAIIDALLFSSQSVHL